MKNKKHGYQDPDFEFMIVQFDSISVMNQILHPYFYKKRNAWRISSGRYRKTARGTISGHQYRHHIRSVYRDFLRS